MDIVDVYTPSLGNEMTIGINLIENESTFQTLLIPIRNIKGLDFSTIESPMDR
jgi:hypothetical protein